MLARCRLGIAACVGAIILLGLCLTAAARTMTLTLLHVNDVYEISPQRGKGGFAQLMTLLRQERDRAAHHITTFGGDLLSPSVLSSLQKGAQMIDLMNAIGLDLATLGNHEFDFGPEVLKQRIAASQFTWLATNTRELSGKPFGGAHATTLRKMGDLTLGALALLTPETSSLSKPGVTLTFAPVIDAAQAAVHALKAQGADLIIALTHQDIARDRALARQVADIDVILGGHDHDPMLFYERQQLIVKAGYDAHYLAVVDLHIEKRETPRGATIAIVPQWRFRSTYGVEPDAEVAGLVARYEKQLDRQVNVPIGRTAVELDTRRALVRTQESNFGNLVADAIRNAVDAEVGLANGGGIRGDRTYDAGTTLTRKDVLTELPFGNVTVLLELSGRELLSVLEHGVSRIEDRAGRFLQVSGLRFRYDPRQPIGSRILEVEIGGQPLRKARRYRVATNDYLAKGGDGYAMLATRRPVINAAAGTLITSQVIRYITAQGTIAPRVEGRITEKR